MALFLQCQHFLVLPRSLPPSPQGLALVLWPTWLAPDMVLTGLCCWLSGDLDKWIPTQVCRRGIFLGTRGFLGTGLFCLMGSLPSFPSLGYPMSPFCQTTSPGETCQHKDSWVKESCHVWV